VVEIGQPLLLGQQKISTRMRRAALRTFELAVSN
jgi:hypothetical protein